MKPLKKQIVASLLYIISVYYLSGNFDLFDMPGLIIINLFGLLIVYFSRKIRKKRKDKNFTNWYNKE